LEPRAAARAAAASFAFASSAASASIASVARRHRRKARSFERFDGRRAMHVELEQPCGARAKGDLSTTPTPCEEELVRARQRRSPFFLLIAQPTGQKWYELLR
jgi:hypothetical protein